MNDVSRFNLPPDDAARVTVFFDGRALNVPQGVSVAAALLAHIGKATRHTAQGDGRAAFCMMGVCFECLVTIDGTPNTQACMTEVRDGMHIHSQSGHRPLSGDPDAPV